MQTITPTADDPRGGWIKLKTSKGRMLLERLPVDPETELRIWLRAKDEEELTDAVIKSLEGAGYPPSEWLSTLTSFTTMELASFLGSISRHEVELSTTSFSTASATALMDALDEDEPAVALITVVFTEPGSLGLRFSDNRNTGGVDLVQIQPGSQAEQHPELRTGLVVHSVGDTPVLGKEYADTIALGCDRLFQRRRLQAAGVVGNLGVIQLRRARRLSGLDQEAQGRSGVGFILVSVGPSGHGRAGC